MDKEKKNLGPSAAAGRNDQVDQLLRKLNPEMKRAKPGPEALAAALEAVERLAAEADAADAADEDVTDLVEGDGAMFLKRPGGRFGDPAGFDRIGDGAR